MILSEKEADLLDSYINGNFTEFEIDLNKLTKIELVEFIYNVQEQGICSVNEILSICRKYLK